MKKKAITNSEFVYLILGLIFIAMLGGFIGLQMNGASIWGQYYSKSIASIIINQAEDGDEFSLDIHKATGVASLNGESDFNKTITFNNDLNEVCSKLSLGKRTCYRYFNNVDIIDKRIRYGDPVNLLQFKVVKKQNLEEIDQTYSQQNEILA